VVHAITAAGREAYYEPSTDSIIDKLKARCTKGDVIIIFSNGGFDGIHAKLIDRLK
jgi:UDP-N-acetylmuramate: L-alanyl-gamma-D-glutamyl-meso-diaminopimelate ligase